VDDHLFCVSRADRTCLLRDLKAHARELTTDEATRDEFKGRYGITDDQLRDLLGDPRIISEMYIRAVRRTPSAGMRVFLVLAAAMSLWLVYLGVDSLDISTRASDGQALSFWRGVLMVVAGLSGLVLTLVNQLWYRSTYFTVPFICLYMVLVSQPVCISITHLSTRGLGVDREVQLFPWIYPILLMETFVVVALGLYLALVHYRAFAPERADSM